MVSTSCYKVLNSTLFIYRCHTWKLCEILLHEAAGLRVELTGEILMMWGVCNACQAHKSR